MSVKLGDAPVQLVEPMLAKTKLTQTVTDLRAQLSQEHQDELLVDLATTAQRLACANGESSAVLEDLYSMVQHWQLCVHLSNDPEWTDQVATSTAATR